MDGLKHSTPKVETACPAHPAPVSFLSSCPSGHLGGGPQSLLAFTPSEPCPLVLLQTLEDSLLLHGPAQRRAATGASAEPVLRPLTLGTSQAPHGASQVALVVKKPPTDAGDIRDPGSILGREDPLEEDMATHSSIFAQRIPWMEEPGRPQSMGSQRVGHD